MFQETSKLKTHLVTDDSESVEAEVTGSEQSDSNAGQINTDGHVSERDGTDLESLSPPQAKSSDNVNSLNPITSAESGQFLEAERIVVSSGSGGRQSVWQFLRGQMTFLSWMSCAVLCALISYLSTSVLTGSIYWGISGVQANEFNHSIGGASASGAILISFLQVCFFSAIAGRKSSRFTEPLKICLASAVVFIAASYGLQYAVEACFCVALTYGIGAMGKFVREALPPTFRMPRASLSRGLAMLPPALLMLYLIIYCMNNPSPPSETIHFSDYTAGGTVVGACLAALFVFLPAFFLARCGRTSEFKPLFVLNLVMEAPLLITLSAALLFMVLQSGALMIIPAALAVLAFVVAVIAASTWLGAVCNKHLHQASLRHNQ